MVHHVEVLVPLSAAGIDFSITKPVIIMWGTSAFIFLFLLVANWFHKFRMVEAFVYDFVVDAFASSLPTQRRIWFSFLMTLFLFVFFNNISGLIPGGEAPTSNINVTAGLAILVFVIAHGSGIINHGFHHISNLIPDGVPKFLYPFMFILELVSHLARPFSLAVRLFANMFAGHQVLTIFLGLAIVAPSILKLIPFGGVVMISFFEIFVAFIQSFIFTYLASFYISDAVGGAH